MFILDFMGYIYMDESGDLGFDFSKEGTSNYFIITFLYTQNPQPLIKVAKKVVAGLNKRQKKNHDGILHANKELDITRRRTLNYLNKQDIKVFYIYVKKDKINHFIRDKTYYLYNVITGSLLKEVISNNLIPLNGVIKFIASRIETNKILNKNFVSHLKNQINTNSKFDLDILIKPANTDRCLQIVDMVSWGIFRKLEVSDPTYYNLIQSKIVKKDCFFL